MIRSSVVEYAGAIRDRYRRASRKEKKRILDEFTQVAGYHRKSAIPLLTTKPKRHNRTKSAQALDRLLMKANGGRRLHEVLN